MQKNRLIPIVLILFGAALIVAASLLYARLGALWFGILFPLGVFILAAGFYEFKKTFKKSDGGTDGAPRPEVPRELPEYRRKKTVLTKPEIAFYTLLRDILHPQHFDIFPETALVSVIDKVTQAGYRNELFRIADFCIVDALTTEPLLLIEINDASHARPDRVERDRKVKEICGRADLPIVMFSYEEARSAEFVKKILAQYL
ncbi:MAG: DUF2726 domain-containing protein [Firmicutes bacterium]|nr:DUF2726 domain-containing protein [Bacillota bacterium]